MSTEPVDSDRQRRDTVRAQSTGPEEAVFDINQRIAQSLKLSQRVGRRFRLPYGDGGAGRNFGSSPKEAEWRRAIPEEWRDMILLPEGEAKSAGDFAVGVDQLAPESAELDRFACGQRLAGERVLDDCRKSLGEQVRQVCAVSPQLGLRRIIEVGRDI